MSFDYSEGKLFLESKTWTLDAYPHVCLLLVRLFPGSKATYKLKENIIYTKRPREMHDSTEVRKNLNWFIKRFRLEISEEDLKKLESGDKKFERQRKLMYDSYYKGGKVKLDFALPLRDYQQKAVRLCLKRGSLLVADQVGLGKTPIGIAIGRKVYPCVCVVPPHLRSQWRDEIKKFLPNAKILMLEAGKKYDNQDISGYDFYVSSYSMIWKYATQILEQVKPKSIVLDEVHSLRNNNTKKYEAIQEIAFHCTHKIGLSATPVMNYGHDIYNIYQILEKDTLGDRDQFIREWCNWGRIADPELLGQHLRQNMMMVRRTRKEVQKEMDPVNRIVYNVDADMETLKKMEEESKALALTVLTGAFHESGEAARQLDYKLRQATGVAKAKSVAEMVKIAVESGEKVVLFGWHREVYDIWKKELKQYYPAMYTGSESPKQKEESLRRFIEEDWCKVFIMSLRSGAGINGLQFVSSYAIFGELDWTPGIMEQCIGRLWRDGQNDRVTAMFITIDDGADPIMKKVIGFKADEAKKILDPTQNFANVAQDRERFVSMAKEYLRMKGEDVDALIKRREREKKGGLIIDGPKEGDPIYEMFQKLSKIIVSTTKEERMQQEIENMLERDGISYKREYIASDNSRFDFLIEDKYILECKTRGFSKRDMLRQVKRYLADYRAAKAVIVMTPDFIHHFSLGGVPVYTINTSDGALIMGGLA